MPFSIHQELHQVEVIYEKCMPEMHILMIVRYILNVKMTRPSFQLNMALPYYILTMGMEHIVILHVAYFSM